VSAAGKTQVIVAAMLQFISRKSLRQICEEFAIVHDPEISDKDLRRVVLDHYMSLRGAPTPPDVVDLQEEVVPDADDDDIGEDVEDHPIDDHRGTRTLIKRESFKLRRVPDSEEPKAVSLDKPKRKLRLKRRES